MSRHRQAIRRLVRAWEGGHVAPGPGYQDPHTAKRGISANIGLMNAAADYVAENANEDKARDYLSLRLVHELGGEDPWGFCQNEILGQYENWHAGAWGAVQKAAHEKDDCMARDVDDWLDRLAALLALHAFPGDRWASITSAGMRCRLGYQMTDKGRGILASLLFGETVQVPSGRHYWPQRIIEGLGGDPTEGCLDVVRNRGVRWMDAVNELVYGALEGLRTLVPISLLRQPGVCVSVLERGHSSGMTRPLMAAWNRTELDAEGYHDVYPPRRGSFGSATGRIRLHEDKAEPVVDYDATVHFTEVPLSRHQPTAMIRFLPDAAPSIHWVDIL